MLLGGIAVSATSCKESGTDGPTEWGTVSGTVVDEIGVPVSGATITVSGMDETATSGADGSYSIDNVSNERHAVSASKDGYQPSSKTVRASSFVDGKATGLDLSILRANSRISGVVLDETNNSAPLSGVRVKAGTKEAVTGNDGRFEIEGLALSTYSLSFTYGNYGVVQVSVPVSSFVNEAYDTGSIYLGGGALIGTMTRYDLAASVKLLYDDYRSGNARGPVPSGTSNGFWDWASGFMAAVFDRTGNVEIQSEGFALRPISSALANHPATDLENFDTRIWGIKKITSTNSKMTVRVRCHQAPATFGVQVVNLDTPTPTLDRIAHYTHPNDQYINYNFDLSAYEDKTVVVILGQYIDLENNSPTATDYWHQIPVGRITFSSAWLPSDQTWWPGDEVIEGWKLTRQMVANAGVQTRSAFTGARTGTSTNHSGIGAWKGTGHIGEYWHYIGIEIQPEPLREEGFTIKTPSANPVSTTIPKSFIYAKFAISPGADKMVLTGRTLSDANDTFFKFAVFDAQGNFLAYVQPSTGATGSAGLDGTWKFRNNTTTSSTFEFDLSAYDGQMVAVAIAAMKGEANDEENKLVIQSIVLQ